MAELYAFSICGRRGWLPLLHLGQTGEDRSDVEKRTRCHESGLSNRLLASTFLVGNSLPCDPRMRLIRRFGEKQQVIRAETSAFFPVVLAVFV